eukprot:772035-Rhodomonas_salina.2
MSPVCIFDSSQCGVAPVLARPRPSLRRSRAPSSAPLRPAASAQVVASACSPAAAILAPPLNRRGSCGLTHRHLAWVSASVCCRRTVVAATCALTRRECLCQRARGELNCRRHNEQLNQHTLSFTTTQPTHAFSVEDDTSGWEGKSCIHRPHCGLLV